MGSEMCIRDSPCEVWSLLSTEAYVQRWPLIPKAELEASSVEVTCDGVTRLVLLHKRRVTPAMLQGTAAAPVCHDCFAAFRVAKGVKLCRYALPNDLWLGRQDPLLAEANLAHQLLLAKARVVAWKIILRKDESTAAGKCKQDAASNKWDFLFNQSGFVGSAILFSNSDAKRALDTVPARSIVESFAITVCGPLEVHQQEEAKKAVSKIAKLMVNREEFVKQARALSDTNVVYRDTACDEKLLATWCPDPATSVVPPPVLDAVVAVPLDSDSPGTVLAEGPADSTEGQQHENAEEDIAAAREGRFVCALEPSVTDLNEQDHATWLDFMYLQNLQ